MKLSVSAYRAHASAHKKILSSSYQLNYGSTAPAPTSCTTLPQFTVDEPNKDVGSSGQDMPSGGVRNEGSSEEAGTGSQGHSLATSRDDDDDDSSNNASSECKSPGQRTKSNQRWMKLRTTVQLSSAIQKKPPLKREDSFLKRFSTRQIPETQETVEDTGSEGGGVSGGGSGGTAPARRRRRTPRPPRTVVNPDENFYFYWLWVLTGCVLYNLWTLIVRQSFPELQQLASNFWFVCDTVTDIVFTADLAVQLRTGYLEQGLMVYDSKKLAGHYLNSKAFLLDLISLTPLDLLQLRFGPNPMLRFPRFFKVYRAVNCYYIVESRTVYPNFWRVINLIHILLILAHWFGCFYFLLSEAEGFQGDWVYPHRPGDYATLTRKYLGSLYWSTLTLTTIGDLPTPETNAEASQSADGPKSLPRRGLRSRLLQFRSNKGYVFTIVSYLIGVFIFATIVGQVGNVITNRNANRLEFERLLDGAKTYMRHHKVPGGMKRRVLRWYDYSWSRGRIQGGGDINTALGLLPDKLKTELALHVNLSVLKKVTIFQECQPEFLHDLVLKMKAYIFTPGDSICRKGEVAREMFIIADGILEVISETGKVLTTMKAGDFFGEIGILNLDGLNKRTADVRSVGYSELFSLSREDVLAAMKDYPEAQEILQTLGRKRLQEARNCSRKAKGEPTHDKMNGEESTGTKKIVHRLRSDVKGLKNALRSRSRPSRRSATCGESLELRTIGSTSGGGSAMPKGVLRRMPRVESDETHHAEDEANVVGHGNKDEKVISPLGAGLPLLARLKLLKEKQEKEEKEASMSRGRLSIPQLTMPVASTSTSKEPEVIGAGLPLLQRLLLLKAKEDRERAAALALAQEKATLTSNPPSSSDTISPSSLKSPVSPTVKTLSPIRKESGPTSPGKSLSPTTKSIRKNSSGSSDSSSKPKVSFKDKIMKLQGDGTKISQPLPTDDDEVERKPRASDKIQTPSSTLGEKILNLDTLKPSISIPSSVVSRIKSPSKIVGTTFRDKLKLLQVAPPTSPKEMSAPELVPNKIDLTSPNAKKFTLDPKIFRPPPSDGGEKCLKDDKSKTTIGAKKPWTKLKKASILSESKDSITSSNSQQSCSLVTDSPMDNTLKSAADTDITSAKTPALSMISIERVVIQSSVASSNNTISVPTQNLVSLSENNNIELENKNVELLTSKPSDNLYSVLSDSTSNVSISSKREDGAEVEDLAESLHKPISPSAEIVKPKQPLTLITKKHKRYLSVEDLSPEYCSLPFVKKLKILNERQKLEELENEVQKQRSSSLDYPDTGNGRDPDILTRSISEGSKMHRNRRRDMLKLTSLECHGSQSLLSPESNETLERRTLKSILKKLSEDTQIQDSPIFCPKEFKKLIRAPTIEGYAARHSKFTKSVTFNRNTLTSPPTSENEQKELFPLTNPYQRLTSTQSESTDKVEELDDIWGCDKLEDDVPKSTDLMRDVCEDLSPCVPETSTLLEDILAEKQTRRDLEEISSNFDAKYGIPVLGGLHPEDIRVPSDKPKLSLITTVANQRKLFRGSLEEQEYYSDVLLGIKHVIQGHLHEVQGKFQERFSNLEMEVRKRDEIITQLQSRIQELERIGLSTNGNESIGLDNLGFEPTTPEAPSVMDRSLSADDQSTTQADLPSTTLNISSGSDDISQDQGFMRGDSLDTVFTTSPPNLAAVEDEEVIANQDNSLLDVQNIDSSQTELDGLDLERDDNQDKTLRTLALELQRLSDSGIDAEQLEMLISGERRMSQPTLMLRLDRPDTTYSRHRAKKMKERRSWEESCDQESMEMSELPRSLSPLNSGDQQALLSPSTMPDKYTTRQRRSVQSHPFHMFGSHLEAKSKIKKTASVDTGIHHAGKRIRVHAEQEHRKFSLGSFFGYHKSGQSSSKQPEAQRETKADVVLDIGTDLSSEASTSSSSSESDYLPRTPVFEHFRDSMMGTSGSSSGLTGDRGGGDWEVRMLAEELDRRERDEAKKKRRRQEHTHLRSLEEESDSPTTPHDHSIFSEEDFQQTQAEIVSPYESPYRLQKTSSFHERTSTPPDWLQRRSRGLILRASSLEHPEPSRSQISSNLTGKSSSSDGSHKHL